MIRNSLIVVIMFCFSISAFSETNEEILIKQNKAMIELLKSIEQQNKEAAKSQRASRRLLETNVRLNRERTSRSKDFEPAGLQEPIERKNGIDI